MFSGAFAFVALLGLYTVSKLLKRSRQRAREARVRLEGEEVSQAVTNYGSISRPQRHEYVIGDARSDIAAGPIAGYYPDQPRWVI